MGLQCKGATSEETAYPMCLAKMFASCSVNALLSKGIAAPPATLEDIKDTSLQSFQQMRASTGVQPKATFSTKVKLRAPSRSLPSFKNFQKTADDIVCNESRKQTLLKRARLLSILPSGSGSGGEDDDAWEFVDNKNLQEHSQDVHVQICGTPWSPGQFVRQGVKARHPMLLQACLPPLLKELVSKYHSTSTLDRVQHRTSRVKHWMAMARAKQLEEADRKSIKGMRRDVASVLHGKRILLWEEMLKAIG